MIKFEIEIFLHGHFETGEPCEIDVFGITNVYEGRVPFENMKDIEESMADNIGKFKGMKTEECYKVEGELKFETGDMPWDQACWFEIIEIKKEL